MARRKADEILPELDEAKDRHRRLGEELTALASEDPDEVERSAGWQEHYERIERGYQRAGEDVDRLDSEWRRAVQYDQVLTRARDDRYVESGDGSRREPDRDRGAANLRAGLPQHGRPLDAREEQQVIERAMRVRDDAVRRHELGEGGGENIEYLLRSERSDNYDPGYIARRIEVTMDPDYVSGFWRQFHAIARGVPANLSQREVDAVRRYEDLETAYARAFANYTSMGQIERAMSEFGSATSAGLGVPSFIDPSIILTSGAADVPLLRVCRIENVTTNLWKGLSSSGVVWAYTTESTESTDDAPTLSQPTVPIHTARAYIPYSIEASMDMVNFASEISRLVNSGYNDLLATKTMQGTGTGQPTGVFPGLVAVGGSQVATTTDGSFGGADIFAVWAALPERFRANATWVMSVSVQNAIRSFAASTSATSAYFTIDLTGGMFRINDRPVIVTDYAPSFSGAVPGTTGSANILAVSDWRQSYVWANRAGMSIEQIPMIMGSNQRPTMQRGLLGWTRNGGGIVASEAGRILLNT